MLRDKKGRFVKKFREGGTAEVKPAGVKIINSKDNESDENKNNKVTKKINKEYIADTLELFRFGLNYFTNKKIGELAEDSTKPVLEQVSDVTLPVYGNYRSLIGGQKSAADIRNSVSTHLTSDGALHQNMKLQAEIEAQKSITEGLSDDEDFYRKSIDRATNENIQNQLNRSEKANTNMKTLINYGQNLAGIEIDTLSSNVKDVVNPPLERRELRFRSLGEKQQNYQDYYDQTLVDKQVWYGYSENLTDDEKKLKDIYNTQGREGITKCLEENPNLQEAWDTLNIKMNNEIIRRQVALKGVNVNIPEPAKSSDYGIWDDNVGYNWGGFKKGGKLIKHTNKDKQFLENTINQKYTYRQLIPKSKKKYQTGGNLPFVSFTPVSAPSSNHYQEEQDDTEDLTNKDILEILNDMEGLDSDREAIIHSLKYFSLNDPMDPLGLSSSSNIVYKYATIINNIKKAKNNKEWFDKAYEQLRENYALDELAVTKEGYFIGVKEGDYEYISPYEVQNKAKEGYSILTNSNLLYLRNTDPNLAFETATIAQAASGISMQQITEYLNETIKGLGSDRTEYTVFGGQQQDVVNGLKQLQEAAKQLGQDLSLSDLYEATILTEHQKNQIIQALTYLYQTLPTNMKSLLIAKGGSEEGALNLINNLIHSKTSNVYKIDFSPKKGSSSSSNSKGSADTGTLSLSPAQMLQQGFGERELVNIQNGSSTALQMYAIKMPITRDGNNTVGATTLEDITTTEYGGILDFTNASIGGQVIPFEGRSNVVVDGNRIYSMYLPIDQAEYVSNGNIVPDIALMDKLNKVNTIIRNNNITDPQKINEIYVNEGLPVFLNDDGTVIPTQYRRFGVLNGTVLDKAFGDNFVKTSYLKELKDDDIINNTLAIMNKGRSEKDRIEYDPRGFFNFRSNSGNYDSMYQGTVFIPISNDVFLGIAGSGETIDSNDANWLEAKQQQQRRTSTYINPGQLQ